MLFVRGLKFRELVVDLFCGGPQSHNACEYLVMPEFRRLERLLEPRFSLQSL